MPACKGPQVMSSKKKVSPFRQVINVPVNKSRDPRFERHSGNLNVGLFERSYGFLEEYHQVEMKQLKNELDSEEDPGKKEKLKQLYKAMQAQEKARLRKKRIREIQSEHRRSERELVKQGKQPYFLKHSDVNRIMLAEEFKNIESLDSVEKKLAKRRKKLVTKQRRKMPNN